MMIPFRSISQLIGAKAGYALKSKTATISIDGKKDIFINSEASIEIIYAVDAERAKSDVLHPWNSLDRNDIRKQRLRAVEEKALQAGVKFSTKILFGEPGPEIVKHANENKMDLVIIGSRGLNSLQEFVLGSVSHKVAKRAPGRIGVSNLLYIVLPYFVFQNMIENCNLLHRTPIFLEL